MSDERALNIVFDGPPSHESGRFIDVETDDGHSVSVGEWIRRADENWALRITADDLRATAGQPQGTWRPTREKIAWAIRAYLSAKPGCFVDSVDVIGPPMVCDSLPCACIEGCADAVLALFPTPPAAGGE